MNGRNSTESIMEKDSRLLSRSVRIPFFPLVARTGQGAILEDLEGEKYIDFLSFGAISNVGHNHPAVVEAIKAQAETLIHCNPAYAFNERLTELTEELVAITPGTGNKKVAYGLSGADANDGAIKAARAYTGRQKIIAFLRSYHGNTYGAMSLSAVSLPMRYNFGPGVPEIYHIPYPDCHRCPMGHCNDQECQMACYRYFLGLFETLFAPDEVAAVIMEPIQGDAGIIIPPQDYMKNIYDFCKNNGILFVSEEVQTGMGRTGRWFGIENFNLEPDIIVVGKALASGMPLSALVARGGIFDAWSSPGHVFSTSGNPVCCAAAIATINVIRREGLLEKTIETGRYIKERLDTLTTKYQQVSQVRGLGFMIGVELVKDRASQERARDLAAKIVWRCYERGLYLTFFSGSVLRICPPLVINWQELDQGLSILEEAIGDAISGRVPDSVLETVKGW
ncbi:MAG TPA: aspartate aminotransferase family protein [Clostridiales bacterium]|nr:aspartate aminotransferase family protein [Clostridiales bacterium]